MGKYMKKTRGLGGAIEVTAHGQLGVRTRARAQALEKIKELITRNCGDNTVSSSPSTKSFAPTQISYLELRSRRLEKTMGCAANRKGNSVDECRRLSDLTNSDVLADGSSRLALSAEDARSAGRHNKYGMCDENRQIIYHFYWDNEVEEELPLHGCVRSLQQWGNRGRAPPSVAQSRSNSRSNSVTRELPPPTHELPPRGILTRNQRKMQKQCSETITCIKGVADMDVEEDWCCHAKEYPASRSPNNCLARSLDVEVPLGEKSLNEDWFARDRFTVSHVRDLNAPSLSVRRSPEFAAYDEESPPPNAALPSDMELENFFLQAELHEQRRFREQYNFDPVLDTPLPGRYDWVSL